MSTGDQPAFPVIVPEGDQKKDGLTKREYFAGLAMQGVLAGNNFSTRNGIFIDDGCIKTVDIAKTATYLADAIIAELNKMK